MDQSRFDRLTRVLAQSTSRRTALRTLLGLGGVTVTGTILFRDADAARRGTSGPTAPTAQPTLPPPPTATQAPPTQVPPTATASCAGVLCSDGCCDGSCTATGVCCPAGSTVCGPDCCPDGVAQCCDNACCFGTCYGEELCCPTGQRVCNGVCLPGGACCGDDDCGSGRCVDGTCIPNTPTTEPTQTTEPTATATNPPSQPTIDFTFGGELEYCTVTIGLTGFEPNTSAFLSLLDWDGNEGSTGTVIATFPLSFDETGSAGQTNEFPPSITWITAIVSGEVFELARSSAPVYCPAAPTPTATPTDDVIITFAQDSNFEFEICRPHIVIQGFTPDSSLTVAYAIRMPDNSIGQQPSGTILTDSSGSGELDADLRIPGSTGYALQIVVDGFTSSWYPVQCPTT